MAIVDYTGRVFGELRVVNRSRLNGITKYECQCSCGKQSTVRHGNLQRGLTKSCGCCEGFKTHGCVGTRLYRIWNCMRDRCKRSNHTSFADYGGRGISVCQEWGDFATFQSWAVSNGYTDSLEIDRIDNDGNYEPSNCRWVTDKVNANNKRNTRWITIFGETKTLAQWVVDERCHVDRMTVHRRLARGWVPELAIL